MGEDTRLRELECDKLVLQLRTRIAELEPAAQTWAAVGRYGIELYMNSLTDWDAFHFSDDLYVWLGANADTPREAVLALVAKLGEEERGK